MPSNTHDVVVVIGTYNEAQSITRILDALPYPVVVVDNLSDDDTPRLVERHDNARLIQPITRQSIAANYALGLKYALGDCTTYIVQMDAGYTHDPRLVRDLVRKAEDTHADLIIGSRFADCIYWRSYRTALSLTAAWLMRRLGVSVTDATCGLRCWRRTLLQECLLDRPLQSRGFAFQLELLWRAHRSGAHIEETLVTYQLDKCTFRWSMAWEALRLMWRFAWE